MKLSLLFSVFCFSSILLFAQEFPQGTNAIHKDSSIIVSWAVSAVVERGYINIADTAFTYSQGGVTSNKAWHGKVQDALGKADGNAISLGDGGHIILEFENPIFDGNGPDFVVFENAIFTPQGQTKMAFLELGFVEVSSNGVDYARFPAVTEYQFETQIGSFDAMDRDFLHNFAGNFPTFYGTPFDLAEINDPNVDVQNITHVKIIDVVGNINPEYASYDSQGNIVNDPWPTPFYSCGFDLDAVGVINSAVNVNEIAKNNFQIFPNPTKDFIKINSENNIQEVYIFDNQGRVLVYENNLESNSVLDLSSLNSGVYFIRIFDGNNFLNQKIVKLD